MDDKHITGLLFDRSERALAILAQKFGPRLFLTARNILGNTQDAEECVSDTYLTIWNAVPPQQPNPLSGFVFKTGRNLALKRLRHNTATKRNNHYDVPLDELCSCISVGSLEEAISARELASLFSWEKLSADSICLRAEDLY